MKKSELKKIVKAISEKMAETVLEGDDKLYWEKEYGNAILVADIHEVRMVSGHLMTVADVYVLRDDERNSENVCKYIADNLPEMSTLREEARANGDVDEGFRDLNDYYQYKFSNFVC